MAAGFGSGFGFASAAGFGSGFDFASAAGFGSGFGFVSAAGFGSGFGFVSAAAGAFCDAVSSTLAVSFARSASVRAFGGPSAYGLRWRGLGLSSD